MLSLAAGVLHSSLVFSPGYYFFAIKWALSKGMEVKCFFISALLSQADVTNLLPPGKSPLGIQGRKFR